MTERRTGGTGGARRAAPEPKPIVVRIGSILLPLAIVALFLTLAVFGDSIFDGGSEPDRPNQGATASSPVGETRTVLAETAAGVLETWSRPGADYAGWWRRLQPMLTPGGQEAYAQTDPAQLPRLEDIALEEVVLHPPGNAATVYFTTSAGRFGVDLSRRASDAAWLANRVVFPDGESMFA